MYLMRREEKFYTVPFFLKIHIKYIVPNTTKIKHIKHNIYIDGYPDALTI